MYLPTLINAARTSKWKRTVLNQVLGWKIPFNHPHGFRVEPLVEGGIRVRIPYWHVNRNHIRGIHACALATGAEFCSGLALLEHLNPKKYRLIMSTLHMDYHYQAKTTAYARFTPTVQEISEIVLTPLNTEESVSYAAVVELHDAHDKHLATGHITWQVKEWGRVRTKV